MTDNIMGCIASLVIVACVAGVGYMLYDVYRTEVYWNAYFKQRAADHDAEMDWRYNRIMRR